MPPDPATTRCGLGRCCSRCVVRCFGLQLCLITPPSLATVLLVLACAVRNVRPRRHGYRSPDALSRLGGLVPAAGGATIHGGAAVPCVQHQLHSVVHDRLCDVGRRQHGAGWCRYASRMAGGQLCSLVFHCLCVCLFVSVCLPVCLCARVSLSLLFTLVSACFCGSCSFCSKLPVEWRPSASVWIVSE